ncbi:MAG: hypothetical protein LAE24_06890 [Candidatus Contendobacter sp.]|nr:hypothetical protein [Candidatus Contendobacter sp.]
MRDALPLRVELYPSRRLLIGGSLSHLLAGVAVLIASIPWWIKVGIIAGIGLSLVWLRFRYGDRNGRGFITRIEWLDGRWRLETGDGRVQRGHLTGGYAHPQLILLNFRLDPGGRRALTLLPDAADSDALRQLRVWLRTWRG